MSSTVDNVGEVFERVVTNMNWLKGAQLTEEENETLGEVLKKVNVALYDCREHRQTLVHAKWQVVDGEGSRLPEDLCLRFRYNAGSINMEWVDRIANIVARDNGILMLSNGPSPVEFKKVVGPCGDSGCEKCCNCLFRVEYVN